METHTTEKTHAARNPILDRITEAEIHDWMIARIIEAQSHGIPVEHLDFTVVAYVHGIKGHIPCVQVSCYISENKGKHQAFHSGSQKNSLQAIDNVGKEYLNYTPERVAETKRAQAAKLLAEADALAPVTPADTAKNGL